MYLNMHKILKEKDELEIETTFEDYYINENKLYMFISEDDIKIDYRFIEL